MTRPSLQTGEGTSAENDVADPHPSTEEHYDKIPRPGGAKPPKASDPEPNSYLNDGKPLPRDGEKPR